MDNDLKPDNEQPKPDFSVESDGEKIKRVGTYNPKKLHHKRKLGELTKHEKWVLGTEIGIAVIGVVLVIFILFRTIFLSDTPPPHPKPAKKVAKVAPVVITSRLSGEPVTAAQEALPVIGVMIENTPDARPQSGLSQAGVVIEALAEGGITRFLALFEEGTPSSIGPVRSARPYYVNWDLGFDAGYVHAGGSPDGLALISSEHVKDLNALTNGSFFHRISTRVAPHNLYTSMSDLTSFNNSKGFTTSEFDGFPRKPDAPLKVPTDTKISFNPSYSTYSSSWTYVPSTNSYLRDEDGTALTDANTGAQIQSKVVIGMVIPWTNGPIDSSGAAYVEYSELGSGAAYVFQDGGLTLGTWTKTSPTAQIVFKNSAGQPLKLNAGQTWITVVASPDQLTSDP
jgi:hypothetical protein